jgi:hypothetical protein
LDGGQARADRDGVEALVAEERVVRVEEVCAVFVRVHRIARFRHGVGSGLDLPQIADEIAQHIVGSLVLLDDVLHLRHPHVDEPIDDRREVLVGVGVVHMQRHVHGRGGNVLLARWRAAHERAEQSHAIADAAVVRVEAAEVRPDAREQRCHIVPDRK